MKGNEEASARALETLLQRMGLGCTWKEVVPANDFPDLEFTVRANGCEERWAVECTDLHQYVDSQGDEVSRVGIDRRIESLCKRIAGKVPSNTVKKYLLEVMGPTFAVPDSVIEKRAIDYVMSGRTAREALDIPELDDADPQVRAAKHSVATEQAKVHIKAMVSPVEIAFAYGVDGTAQIPTSSDERGEGPKMSADIRATIRYALKRVLADKIPKLAQCKHFARRILLIWKGYYLAEPIQVSEAIKSLNWDKTAVDSVLLVLPDTSVHILDDPGKLFETE